MGDRFYIDENKYNINLSIYRYLVILVLLIISTFLIISLFAEIPKIVIKIVVGFSIISLLSFFIDKVTSSEFGTIEFNNYGFVIRSKLKIRYTSWEYVKGIRKGASFEIYKKGELNNKLVIEVKYTNMIESELIYLSYRDGMHIISQGYFDYYKNSKEMLDKSKINKYLKIPKTEIKQMETGKKSKRRTFRQYNIKFRLCNIITWIIFLLTLMFVIRDHTFDMNNLIISLSVVIVISIIFKAITGLYNSVKIDDEKLIINKFFLKEEYYRKDISKMVIDGKHNSFLGRQYNIYTKDSNGKSKTIKIDYDGKIRVKMTEFLSSMINNDGE